VKKLVYGFVALSFAVQACSQSSEPEQKPARPGQGSSVSSTAAPQVPTMPPQLTVPPPNPDTQMTEKLNRYVSKCLNRFSEPVLRSRDRYLSWCAADTGPTGSERHIFGLYKVHGQPSDCAQAVAEAAVLPPSAPELQAAAQSYASALAKILPLLEQANIYYERKNYEDDGFAVGKSLHPQLIAAWTEFDGASKSLSSQVDTLQAEIDVRELARLEQMGKNLQYHIKNVMVISKRVLNEGTVGAGFESIDSTTFQVDVAALEQAVDAMKQFSAANNAEPTRRSSYDLFQVKADRYVISAKELMRRVRDKTPYSRSELMLLDPNSGWMVNGSPNKLLFDYNDLVNRYNVLR
jgi:hypothetical protein